MTGMTDIVKTITRFVSPAIMLFGLYLMLHGEELIGGGFAGGVLLASSLVLISLAYGRAAAVKKLGLDTVLSLASLSVIGFVAVPYGKTLLQSEIFNLLGNVFFGLTVFFVLYIVFLLLSSYRIEKGER